jgi:hypothetical protein
MLAQPQTHSVRHFLTAEGVLPHQAGRFQSLLKGLKCGPSTAECLVALSNLTRQRDHETQSILVISQFRRTHYPVHIEFVELQQNPGKRFQHSGFTRLKR